MDFYLILNNAYKYLLILMDSLRFTHFYISYKRIICFRCQANSIECLKRNWPFVHFVCFFSSLIDISSKNLHHNETRSHHRKTAWDPHHVSTFEHLKPYISLNNLIYLLAKIYHWTYNLSGLYHSTYYRFVLFSGVCVSRCFTLLFIALRSFLGSSANL